ncbi:hypothetical protein NLG97_g3400 [Lecanicillium saksenae]|uniref:Uncharacterized protein n=1 Tax=Lecanicillium saksenae TaxID=468837 RepID=A0ACC1QY77_9HYPO|nr:hypothetical protein NLG97_g3400 [Lecanicillium saksenae]
MSAAESPPPTPPSRPVRDDELRFKTVTAAPCEWIEAYRPGGYHPVSLGDVFDGGRYRVLRKLGGGSYSTVWLARDEREKKYVALKILVAEASTEVNEVRILRHLAAAASQAEAQRHVARLLDEFEHRGGPNGTHKCLVFEPMGPSVNAMVEELPQFKPRRWDMKVRYPPRMARSILKQALEALAFIHSKGVAHGDFQPGNMLFGLRDVDSVPEGELRQEEEEDGGKRLISRPVERLDGKLDKWAPRYLCIAQSLAAFTCYDENLTIKLSDMGGAYFFDDPPPKVIVPRGLRPPELILNAALLRAAL